MFLVRDTMASRKPTGLAPQGLEFVDVREGILLSELNDLFEKVRTDI